MKRSTAAFVASSLLLVAIPAHAAAKGWFAGVGAGQMKTEVDDILGSGFKFDESDTAFKVFGGYKFFPWLSVEGAYVYGGNPEIDEHGTLGGLPYHASLGVEIDSIVTAAVFTLPLGDHFELFAKPGMAWWGSTTTVRYEDSEFSDRYEQDDNGSAFFLGVGGGVSFNEHFGMRLEYEWFDVALEYDDGEFSDDLDASAGLWSASFIYSF